MNVKRVNSETDRAHRSAFGQVLTAGDWLDDHFEACEPLYERMVRAAGLLPGSMILDAGCGTGSFLPLIRECIEKDGSLVAVDQDLGNVQLAAAREAMSDAVLIAGSITSLPFATGSFDAAWCANVTQYFNDAALAALLLELVRVVRPGGLVTVKDVDMTGLRIHPADPLLGARLAEACLLVPPVAPESIGSLRGRALRRWLEEAGLEDVSQQTFPIEYWSPLDAPALRLWSGWLPYLASLAEEHKVAESDLELWRALADPEQAASFVRRPDFYACELQVLAVGRVPVEGGR